MIFYNSVSVKIFPASCKISHCNNAINIEKPQIPEEPNDMSTIKKYLVTLKDAVLPTATVF